MRCLVTGGAGFIGSHIVERLLKDGHSVAVLDNFSSGKEENLSFAKGYPLSAKRYKLIKGDIRDKDTCDKACRGISYIFHQAALRSVPKSLKEPREYNEANINGTLNMLQAASLNKAKRFVFASSSSIYGETNVFPEKENFLPKLISPYALSKLAGEYYCRIFTEFFNLEAVSLRYFNVFGPRQALDDEYAVVIPKFIHCIMHNKRPPIFGTGRQSRDFTYIDNVVEANLLAASTPGIKSEVFNVGGGKDNTVLYLAGVLNKIMKKNIKPEFLPVRPGDVFKTLADISKIKKLLKYKPLASFEEGLKKTVKYFQRAASPA
jgi:nucleoside-diphosphate-sugar epimerase